MEVVKLYKNEGGILFYWETWENNGKIIVHHGKVGDEGDAEEIKSSKSARDKVSKILESKMAEGFAPFPEEKMAVLMIEYKIEGMGDADDLDKRHDLQSRMDNTLGWTGLGHCDGGSIGSGTMEVCNLVVDYEIAKRVIEEDLKGTAFEKFARIYREDE
jgi:hypothetical protein